MPNVYYAGLPVQVHNDDSDLGASWHPNYTGHLKKAYSLIPVIDLGASWHPNYTGHLKKAYSLIPVISTLTGWPMENKPVE